MSRLRAVVLDTEGVLLDSAALHAVAWKSAFDGCLDGWAAGTGRPAQLPFDAERQYREMPDGRPRLDGPGPHSKRCVPRGCDVPPPRHPDMAAHLLQSAAIAPSSTCSWTGRMPTG
ncbi:hypothetical protein GCM10010425_37810 [Streptomyces spororaveus]|uniref:Hydrolase n=1 Tax=Streptomyces spororaveus TaxID=284039 RepID=A0ABQ3TPS7_9ACTN|nr:hypothetical protein Sspor_78730 [Streptomyces spororaveus]